MKDAAQKQQGAQDVNVNSRGAPDDPRTAPESGGPSETGRSHGRAVDEKAEKAGAGGEPMPGRSDEKGNVGRIGEDLESGRQEAV